MLVSCSSDLAAKGLSTAHRIRCVLLCVHVCWFLLLQVSNAANVTLTRTPTVSVTSSVVGQVKLSGELLSSHDAGCGAMGCPQALWLRAVVRCEHLLFTQPACL